MDAAASEALQDFSRRLERKFGDRLEAVYLFGSRARGDHRPDSDADVAVFFKGDVPNPIALDWEMIDDATQVLVERGLHIQPWAMPAGSLTAPAQYDRSKLAYAVLRDGVPLWGGRPLKYVEPVMPVRDVLDLSKAETASASAKALLALGDSDGAANRAYYAMLHAATEAVEASGMAAPRTHKGLNAVFWQRFVETGLFDAELARWFGQSEQLRLAADYSASTSLRTDVERAIEQAEAFIATLKNMKRR